MRDLGLCFVQVRPYVSSSLLNCGVTIVPLPLTLYHTLLTHTSSPTHYHWSQWSPLHTLTHPLHTPTHPHYILTRTFHTLQPMATTTRGDIIKSRLVTKGKRKGKSIKEKEVLIIDETGENLGVLSSDMAIQMAMGRGLELKQVQKESQNTKAVYKFVTKKQLYEEKKEKKQRAKKDPQNVIKTVQMSTNIGSHDFDVKLYRAEQFLSKNHTVRVTVEGNFPRYFSVDQVAKEKKRRVELLNNVEKKLMGVGSKVAKEVVQEGRNLRCDFRPVINTATNEQD